MTSAAIDLKQAHTAEPCGDSVHSLRIAHITDIHIQPERGIEQIVASRLKRIQELSHPPDMIFNGGDIVMDAVAADRRRVDALWDAWDRVAMDCSIPMRYCLGNHDVWGWGRKSGCTGDEPLFGKAYPLSRLRLSSAYYHFDQSGWRFIVLDSLLRIDKTRYAARIDPTQWRWLEETLRSTPPATPILILSHIPIAGGPSVFFANVESETAVDVEILENRDWVVPSWQMHVDSRQLIELFAKYSNVKLCLSGHTHLYERLEFRGVTYINNGALSGQWWRGDFFGTSPGYGLIDLYPDGRFQAEYISVE